MKPLLESIRTLSAPLDPIPTGAALKLAVLDGIETILFDIYGTLLVSGSGDVGTAAAADSAEALIQSLIVSGYAGDLERAGELGPELLHAEIEHWHKAARENGIDFPEVEISRVWKKVLERLQTLGLLKPDDDAQKILQLAVEYECRVNPAWPMPDARQTIDNLRSRGFRLGIVSNAQFYTPLMIEALFGTPLEALGFEKELCVFSYKQLMAKPAVELFHSIGGREAAQMCGKERKDWQAPETCAAKGGNKVDWSTTLYVGNDMLNDIWTAAQVGCRTCLFAGDRRSLRLREKDKRCKKLVPDAIVDHLFQLTEMV
ncbi:MAG: HAD family hydrolase [Kiritimatiellales bacterium]|nr:HAD family hydrolase [Kiritimatiellota bacterium]MBL7011314.1 HAD family hydrolase [Kiritimatiellales bacterium]